MLLNIYLGIEQDYEVIDCVDEDLVWCLVVCCLEEFDRVRDGYVDAVEPFEGGVELLLLGLVLLWELVVIVLLLLLL